MTSGIIEILTENPGIQALVSRDVDNQKYCVFAVRAEQGNTINYITVFKAQNNALSSLTKDLPSELDYPRVVVTCWSKNFRVTELMFEAVRLALDNMSAQTDNGYNFSRIWLVDDRDGYDQEAQLFCHIATFGVEVERAAGDIWQSLIDNNFMTWGGYWVWADHSNNLPTDVQAGRVWLTYDARGVPGDVNFIPPNTLMIATSDTASTFADFTFNIA